ncbi:hypothetical protein DIS24_g9605 [Lasiodiplodia hormozganensis]|uniref:Uncharacterized protein n=1 Tax=Lasiodiplodia hormozganensis TaxID=869390 RepID=A0AA39XTZ3_9PEZI|nr:hypothetical protein DIS24_g9605 [Lasiodiplodia hormozganensis]
MKFSAAIAVAFATLFTSVYSAPTMDIEARAPESIDSATADSEDIDKRQVVTVQAQVSISMVVVMNTAYDQVRVHTGNINNTLSSINGDSNWVVRNNAIMAVRSELTTIGSILAATTSQIGTLGGNIGGDLNAVAYATLRIAYEVIYTIQFAVNRLGAGVIVVLGIIINNLMSVLAGLILAVDIGARGSLQIVWGSLSAVVPRLLPAMGSIVLGLGYLLGF